MIDVRAAVDALSRDHDFSGAVRVDVAGDVLVDAAYGFADRRLAAPNRMDTIFAVASDNKHLTTAQSSGAWPLARLLKDEWSPDRGTAQRR